MSTSSTITHRVPGREIARFGVSWDADLFCRSPYWLLSADGGVAAGRVLEGERSLGEGAEEATVYRPRQIAAYVLQPEPDQWQAPANQGLTSVGPGDVVVTKIHPLRAAWVMPAHHRHPVDSNCLILRNLSRPAALWWLLWLNDPAFGGMLVRFTGGHVLPRVGKGVFKTYRLPDMPPQWEEMAGRAWNSLATLAEADRDLAYLRADVEAAVDEASRKIVRSDEDQSEEASWRRWFPAPVIHHSWVPGHVAAAAQAEEFRKNGSWQSLTRLGELGDSSRFRDLKSEVPVLRLGDVRLSFDIELPPFQRGMAEGSRLYSRPIEAGDVLLSTFVPYPRVTWFGEKLPVKVYPVDHWARLKFPEHAAAWALILGTGPVTRQLRKLAQGSIQQFIKVADLERIYLPVFPRETMSRWETSLTRILARKAEATARWREIESQLSEPAAHYSCKP